jgi:hypothetical protein
MDYTVPLIDKMIEDGLEELHTHGAYVVATGLSRRFDESEVLDERLLNTVKEGIVYLNKIQAQIEKLLTEEGEYTPIYSFKGNSIKDEPEASAIGCFDNPCKQDGFNTVRVFCPRGCYHVDVVTPLESIYVNESCLCDSLMTAKYEESYLKNRKGRKVVLYEAIRGYSEFCPDLARKILKKIIELK